MNGQLEFFGVDDMEPYRAAEHFMCTNIEWDPDRALRGHQRHLHPPDGERLQSSGSSTAPPSTGQLPVTPEAHALSAIPPHDSGTKDSPEGLMGADRPASLCPVMPT